MTLPAKLLNRIAHDIRGAMGVISMANNEIFSGGGEDTAHHRQMVDRGLARLGRITELLSAVGHASESGIKTSPQRASLGPLIERAHVRAWTINPRRQITVELPGETAKGVEASVDEQWLTLSLAEIEMNAIRHAKSKVGIGVARVAQTIELVYSDDGAGFAEGLVVQLPWAKDGTAPGIGLGLAKAVIEALGGSLSLVRPPEGGAKVKVVLPLA